MIVTRPPIVPVAPRFICACGPRVAACLTSLLYSASHTHARVRITPRLTHALSCLSGASLSSLSVPLCTFLFLSAMPDPLFRERARRHPAHYTSVRGRAPDRLDESLTSQIPLLLQLTGNGGVVGQLKQRPSSMLYHTELYRCYHIPGACMALLDQLLQDSLQLHIVP